MWGSMKPKFWFVGGLVLVLGNFVNAEGGGRRSVDLFVGFGARV